MLHAGLSAYLPLRKNKPIISPEASKTPVFLAHGTMDSLVPLHYGELSRDALKEQGASIEFKTYPMAHTACQPEIGDVAKFLLRVVP
jgi:phospholipase/carboxylesterase